jgi:flagellar assembly protein FliH
MSSRARLVAIHGAVQRFDWHGADGPSPASSGPAPLPVVAAADRAAPSTPPELSHAEHQARLAALERDAFAKGYAQGERAGTEAGTKRVEAMIRRVAQTLEELAQLRKLIVRQTEREMVQLALTIARRLVLREVSLDPTLVAAMAHVALERLGEAAPATIKLHPEDYAAISAQRGDSWAGAQVRVVPDASVARGGCLVESAFGTVDGSLDAQVEEMARALLGDGTLPHTEDVMHVG